MQSKLKRNISRLLAVFLFFMFSISCSSDAKGYQLYGESWPQAYTTFYVDIAGENGLWNSTFENAMSDWSLNTSFQYYIVAGKYSDPCDKADSRNGVRFDTTLCGGDVWGSTTLAITYTWTINGVLSETDIVFNSNLSWDVYSSPWYSSPFHGIADFHRVAVHELGHAIGLGHEDSGIPTIMATNASDYTVPQPDDIDGVTALYLSKQNTCASIDTDINIFIPCVNVRGQFYQVTLAAHPRQSLPIGYYWSLASFEQTIDNGTCASFNKWTMDVELPCLATNSKRYALTLKNYVNPSQPSHVAWSLGDYQPL